MRIAALLTGAGALAALSGPAGAIDRPPATWRNPQDSVHVRIEPCGPRMCGVVIWASDKAKADAARGGGGPLVGSVLFRDFAEEKPGVWRGRLFVPDIGKTFGGTISVIDRDHIRGRGCLVGGIGCKSQVWTRIAD